MKRTILCVEIADEAPELDMSVDVSVLVDVDFIGLLMAAIGTLASS